MPKTLEQEKLPMGFMALSCKPWVLVLDALAPFLAAPSLTLSAMFTKVLFTHSHGLVCSNNSSFTRLCRSCVPLRTVLQVCRSWPRTGQRLHGVTAYRRRQDSDKPHWTTNCHVCISSLRFSFRYLNVPLKYS